MKKQKRRETKFRRDRRRKKSRGGVEVSAEKKMKYGAQKAERRRSEKQELECESQKEKKGNERRNMKRKIKPFCNRPIRKYLGDVAQQRRGVRKQGYPATYYPQVPYFSVHV